MILVNPLRENDSLLITAQNNTIRTNNVEVKIAYRLCGDRETKISECSKLAQKEYKTRYDWVGKVIHRELSKKFQFNHTNKWYMHNSEPVLENVIQKVFRDFEIQTDHLISARWSDLLIVNRKKKTCQIVDFAIPADHRIKLKESEKRDKYLDLAWELKKKTWWQWYYL